MNIGLIVTPGETDLKCLDFALAVLTEILLIEMLSCNFGRWV